MDPRYARHLLLPEVGPAGQERLCAHAVSVPDTPAGRVAAAYLRRAGVRCELRSEMNREKGRKGGKREPLPFSPSPCSVHSEDVADVAGRPELTEAAAWLSGAFAAVEEIKRVLDVGEPGSLEGVRLTGPRDEGGDR